MPRRPSLKPVEIIKNGEPRFLVHVPKSMTFTGKLERRYFERSTDAETFAAKLRTAYHRGERGGVVDHTTASAVAAADAVLKKAGLAVTVVEAVRTYAEARAVIDPTGATLIEAARAWEQRFKGSRDNLTFAAAAATYVEDNEGAWATRYRKNIDQTLGVMPEWFNKMKLGSIDAAAQLRAVRASASTPTTIETRLRHVAAICAGKSKKRKTTRTVTLPSEEQIEAMLAACGSAEERRVVAVLLFAGVRPDAVDGEITRLQWDSFGADAIHLPASVAKTKSERIIPIRPRLARLIEGHPPTGPVAPPQWVKRIGAIRKAAGVSGPEFQDCTRHAFASHHLVAYGEAETQAAMGHTANSRILFKHYRQAVTTEAATQYFQ